MTEQRQETTQAEVRLYYWQRGTGGSFFAALFELIAKADTDNKHLLAKAFPGEVKVFRRYQEERGYWEYLQKRIEGEQEETMQ